MRTPDANGSLRLTKRLGIRHPIIQAPMGGGPTTPALVSAVGEAGGLGSVAGGYLGRVELEREIADVQRLTKRPFQVNLFAGGATAGADDLGPMMGLLARWHAALGIAPPEVVAPPPARIAEQLEVVLAARVPVVSFTFGIPDPAVVSRLRGAGVFLMAGATTVEEAQRVEVAGFDAVVVQGSEAGAHRATIGDDFKAAMVGTLALVPQVVDSVSIPVIAAGGIMDGRGIVAAQALGAAAVQMGTAFLLADEAGTSAPYRERLLTAHEDETTLTRAFSGRPARAIRNAFIEEVEGSGVAIPRYPVQNSLTRALRSASAQLGRTDALSLYAGQGIRLARPMPAGRLVAELVREAELVRATLSRS